MRDATFGEHVLNELRATRTGLLEIPNSDLSFALLRKQAWEQLEPTLHMAGQLIGSQAQALHPIRQELDGHERTASIDILDAVRDGLIKAIDDLILTVDKHQSVEPILGALIRKVKDPKLAELLNEFNRAKDSEPNLAAIGFRTILSLIIIERAKIVDRTSKLAIKQDMRLDPDIGEALSSGIFEAAAAKQLKAFQTRLLKDKFDGVAHRTGEGALVDKRDLSAVADLLNQLLRTIVV